MRSGETDREISADEEAVSQAEDPLLAAIEGRYSLSIEGVLSEARKLAEGYKFKLNIAAAIYSLIVITMALLVGGLGALTDNSIFIAIVGELIYAWITLPVAMGLFAISLDRVAGGEVSNDRLFLFFPQACLLYTSPSPRDRG